MTEEENLRDLTDRLEEAKRFATEKRRAFEVMQVQMPGKHNSDWYNALCVAAIAYASAQVTVERLTEEWEDAMADAYSEWTRREQGLTA